MTEATTDKLTEEEQQEVGRKVAEGCTSGLFDNDGHTISWNLFVEKFKHAA